ncbi:unnamed protein product [Penicillium manginii]
MIQVRLEMSPGQGVGPLLFGISIKEAMRIASSWGQVSPTAPDSESGDFKVLVQHPQFEVVLICDDGATLTAVEVWRFEEDDADVQLVRLLTEEGNAAGSLDEEALDEEVTVFPEVALLLSRDTSREVTVDPEDKLPLFFHYALLAPSGYFD